MFSLKRVFGFFLLTPLLAGDLYGLEYSLQPGVAAYATHDDNIRLTPENHLSLQGREVSTSVETQVAAESWQLEFDVDLRFNHYNREDFNSDDQFVDLNFNKDTERQNFGFTSNYKRDSTRTSELESTGIVGLEASRRESYAVSPYWSVMVTEVDRFSINGSYSSVDYDDRASQYTDYEYSVLGMSWFRVINENLTMQLNVTGTEYEAASRTGNIVLFNQVLPYDFTEYKVETSNTRIGVGGEYKFTENFSLSGLVGSTETEQQYDVLEPAGACDQGVQVGPFLALVRECLIEDFNGRSVSGDVTLAWAGERTNWSTRYSIRNQPSSRGYEVESEDFLFKWKYAVSERSSVKFKTLYGKVRSVDETTSAIDPNSADRDFINSNLTLSYRLSRSWQMFTDFAYRWQDRDDAADSAESYAVKLGISYSPVEMKWSR